MMSMTLGGRWRRQLQQRLIGRESLALPLALGLCGVALVVALLVGHHQLPWARWSAVLSQPVSSLSLPELAWRMVWLPRVVVCLLTGAALGAAGALLQQTLRNPLAAPETLGMPSGALLALAVSALWGPDWLDRHDTLVAFAGAAGSALLVLAVASRQQASPLAVLLAGMVISLLASALLTLLMLGHDLALIRLMPLGAGSLAQDGWQAVQQMVWPLGLASGLLCWAGRRLGLLGLEDGLLQGLGVRAGRLRLGCLLLAIWLTAVVVSQVGVIGFVALAAPLLARASGARRPGRRLLCAALLGAAVLLLADLLLQGLPDELADQLPTGSLVALFGAPVLGGLVLLCRLPEPWSPRPAAAQWTVCHPRRWLIGLTLLLGGGVMLALWVGQGATGWSLTASPALLAWRIPRVLAALAAGGMLATAGVLLQRLTGNPRASPEVLGISSSTGLGLVLCGWLWPEAGRGGQWLAGAIAAWGWLLLLLWWGRRQQAGLLRLLLAGMALTMLFGAVQALMLGMGDPRGLQLLSWMSGSTYYVTAAQAYWAMAVAVAGVLLVSLLLRWLRLLPLGSALATSLGVSPRRSRGGVLLLAGALTAAATLLVGPVSFVGLLAPHLVRQRGLWRAEHQLPAAVLLGMAVMVLADWWGRQGWFPEQVPAGIMASLLGGGYFLCGLWMGGRRPART